MNQISDSSTTHSRRSFFSRALGTIATTLFAGFSSRAVLASDSNAASKGGKTSLLDWKCVLELAPDRQVRAGSEEALTRAIRRGADLRIGTNFHHNQHIDTSSSDPQLIREVSEFGVTYLVNNAWVAGIMSLRQPIKLPLGFNGPTSMSFFLYNQNGLQAVAKAFFDGRHPHGGPGPSANGSPANMPKYHTVSSWDGETIAPSQNFVFDFDVFRYFVTDSWREALSHDAQGQVRSGSLEELVDAFSSGHEVKLSVAGLCDDLAPEGTSPPPHEVMIQAGSGYYYTEKKQFMVGTHPVVRVRPSVPMSYTSQGWDFGWLMVRTDGNLVYRRCDPYTLQFEDRPMRKSVRWFIR